MTSCLAFLTASLFFAAQVPYQWFPKAPPLPPPAGQIIRVGTVEELLAAAESVEPGGTILIADGTYFMPRYFEVTTDRVTLRSESGDRNRVVLDGSKSRHGELLGVSRCSGVTIADLTVQNIKWNGIKINSDSGVHELTLRNCVIHNIWQRGVKGVMVPPDRVDELAPRNCRVEFCLFYNDRPKRLEDDADDIAGGNYIGGIDVMYARDWTISDNVFLNIQGKDDSSPGAIFIWVDSRDCVVERNIIVDCSMGISIGNPYKHEGIAVHCTGVTVRNNFITRARQGAIQAAWTEGCHILHNTVEDPRNPFGRSIRLVADNAGTLIANNLLHAPVPMIEQPGGVTLGSNTILDSEAPFVDAASGDLHLKRDAPALSADPVHAVPADVDGEPRRSPPTAGADEPKR